MIVAIGSENPVKVSATKKAFVDRLDVVCKFEFGKVLSGVANQPFNDEIQTGARNRALAIQKRFDADFGVGLEGGITQHQNEYFEYAWCAISDKQGKITYGHSFGVPMPDALTQKILKEGKELGDVLDELLHEKNTKQKDGFFGFATGNRVTRETGYYEMICAALAP
ncbi:MAG: inositol monophosphatase, partial [Candidatus Kerfeldbacteria bacterium CG08_land_8_20_14_0_20_42_7]